ncbi:hypothetical protein UFOVP413_5 [uncultured Caudovirales phage]|uniref:Uncharacterized protein n=1 Tax=uncultured Caudovirales phage TaxID=2100421 RepID=A0A6J5M497_9CAUD|nr:hypothetical protein UFOVP413_5 [uncultured Caudovirales phage]
MKDEFLFSIDAFKPETLPMSRLAEYLAALANLMGNKESVHFDRVKKGSAALRSYVDKPAVLKVRERIHKAKTGSEESEIKEAYDRLNVLLEKDNAKAKMTNAEGAEILIFPGRDREKAAFQQLVQQATSFDGRVMGIKGVDRTKHVTVVLSDDTPFSCECNEDTARQLKEFLFESVLRLHGMAKYSRDKSGAWKMEHFKITAHEEIDNSPLLDAVQKLRGIRGGDWSKSVDPFADLQRLRHGDDTIA